MKSTRNIVIAVAGVCFSLIALAMVVYLHTLDDIDLQWGDVNSAERFKCNLMWHGQRILLNLGIAALLSVPVASISDKKKRTLAFVFYLLGLAMMIAGILVALFGGTSY